MTVIDLYCGGGGASAGMMQAGASLVTGIDILDQAEYPYWFFHADVAKVDASYLSRFDFAWASPPCQAYSYAAARWRNTGREWPDLIDMTRSKLLEAGIPFVIENVPGAPIRKDLMLCGEMFGLKVIRHRIFEIHGFDCAQPDHVKHRGMVKDGHYVTVAGHGGDYAGHNFCKLNELPGRNQLETWQYAMGIPWISSKKTLREVVPPLYAAYIFEQFMSSRGIITGG